MRKPYIIAFANQKGGVGKTTSIINISSWVAEKGNKVLVIDSDPQGNTTSGLGINKKNVKKTTYDAIIGDVSPGEVIIKTDFEKLYVVPSTINLAGAEFEMISVEGREKGLKRFVDKLEGDFDYVMIDCPPSLGLITVNALTCAKGVIIPMQCEYYSLEGLSQLMITIKKVKEVYNKDLLITGIVVTMYNGRLNLSSQVLNEIKKYYGDKLFSVTVPRNVSLAEAPGFGKPINYHDRYSKGSIAYEMIAEELIKRTQF